MKKKIKYSKKKISKAKAVKENITVSKYSTMRRIENTDVDESKIVEYNETNKVYCGDCIKTLRHLPSNYVDLIITSPPYFQQREYGVLGIGNEKVLGEYISNLLIVFKECFRVIKNTGTIVFNIGDKYIDGNLLLVPYRFALAVQSETKAKLINEVTWSKINPVPKQDPKKLISSKEPFFIFAKSDKYFFDKQKYLDFKDKLLTPAKKGNGFNIGKNYFPLIEKSDLREEEKKLARKELAEVIQEVKSGKLHSFRMKIRGLHALPYGGQSGGRLTQIENKGFTIIRIHGNSIKKDIIESTVETIKGNIHPAVYPEFIIQEFIKLLTKENDLVLDPFLGSGTTAVVAKRMKRNYIGIEINSDYVAYTMKRLANTEPSNILELFI